MVEMSRNKYESVEEIGSSRRSSMSSKHGDDDDKYELKWAVVDRLPTMERMRKSEYQYGIGDQKEVKVIDVAKLGAMQKQLFVEKHIKQIENDNFKLLQKQRDRLERVNVKFPTIDVRYRNLCVDAECEVVDGKPLPTLWNTSKSTILDIVKFLGFKSLKGKINILKDICGIIKPARMTLLLGPPGCGKTSLLLALCGKLDKALQASGEVSYNGFQMKELVPGKTAAYISQNDLHIPDMTVRETLNFSARFQGVGSKCKHCEEILKEVIRREKHAGIVPDPDIDTYMKAISVEGLETSLQTDYILKIMGLDVCADTVVGDAMRRGISGGEKKRLTTAEMIVGPAKALFMDEISTGLDSSTTYQIVTCLQQLAHITESTVVISLLQPAPEVYDLFDDVILMAEGRIVYHGPRTGILEYFEECGFRCPEKKGVADFLQEVLSRKDQEQYWFRFDQRYSYVSVDQFSKAFRKSYYGKFLEQELSKPYNKSQCEGTALSFKLYSLPKWELLKACFAREFLLMKRNSFVYIFKTIQLGILAIVTGTVFLRSRSKIDVIHANYYMGSLFYALFLLVVNGIPEMILTVSRMGVFYKQRDFCFYPAWAYSFPTIVLKLSVSFVESFIWTCITYYIIGYSPEASSFFRQFFLLFAIHAMSLSFFRLVASYFQKVVTSFNTGALCFIVGLLFGGFILPRTSLPGWIKWGFWISPLSYMEIGLAVNEFRAPRWQKVVQGNMTIGEQILTSHSLNYGRHFYWICIGALFGYILLLNVLFTLALTFRKPVGVSRTIISLKKLSQLQGNGQIDSSKHKNEFTDKSPTNTTDPNRTGKMVLPFTPLAISFQNVNYYVDTPAENRKEGNSEKQLQLLKNITGAFQPGALSALMGVTGAGKTTLLDVLAGRKTGGVIEGDIRIGGYPKVQQTFARISGYCEQTDIHSPQITVEESVIYSAWLRLPPNIDARTRLEFVNEVLETIELDGIKDFLVGIPGASGLSTEQRKRLTIAVELVSNPSIIFMDEPTSGLDARAAAIVMRAVKNVSETGRTLVCTIHQPSIDIFEAFDELILMKRGGEVIYSGPLGKHSTKVIKYFEGIAGVPRMKENSNPATWMLEVSSMSMEVRLGVDFTKIYKESSLFKNTEELVKHLSIPPPHSNDLHFSARYAQNGWIQFKACLWKQYLAYWRSPSYNLVRMTFMFVASIIIGVIFWEHGQKLDNQQDLFNALASMYIVTLFTGINNCSSVLPFVATERAVVYREHFAGMYAPWAYSLAQVVIEIPYIFVEVVLFMIIGYPLIGYYWTVSKFLWFFYFLFCTLLYFVYLGMMLVALTPNVQLASILASVNYVLFNLFSGFIVPSAHIPDWWIWFFYLCPLSWTLDGLFTSQYGDIDNKEILVFGYTKKSVASFVKDYFGFSHNVIGVVAVVTFLFPLIFAFLFALFIGKLNFQRR